KLVTLGKQNHVRTHAPDPNQKKRQRAAAAALAESSGRRPGDALADVTPTPGTAGARPSIYIFDTAGRQEINVPLIQELKELKEFLQPQETLLVVDAATGQQAVRVATHFNDTLAITGIIVTKLDGDARASDALTMREVTHRPIKFAGTGEKLDQFEVFVPERLAGRI